MHWTHRLSFSLSLHLIHLHSCATPAFDLNTHKNQSWKTWRAQANRQKCIVLQPLCCCYCFYPFSVDFFLVFLLFSLLSSNVIIYASRKSTSAQWKPTQTKESANKKKKNRNRGCWWWRRCCANETRENLEFKSLLNICLSIRLGEHSPSVYNV